MSQRTQATKLEELHKMLERLEQRVAELEAREAQRQNDSRRAARYGKHTDQGGGKSGRF